MKGQLRRIGASLLVIGLLFGVGYGIGQFIHPRHITQAQFGATTVPGFAVGAINAFPPALAAGQAGTVTNTSGFIMQIDGGPVYCNGNQSNMAESTLTLFANAVVQIEYNCPQETLYAKTAVTGPGTSATTGLPNTILAPIFGLEVPIATVTCNASTCGTITDNRPVSSFPSGAQQAGSVTFANLPATYPNGAVLYCSNCTLASSPCTGASTGAMALRVNGAWRCQ